MDRNKFKYHFQLFDWPKWASGKERAYTDWEVFLNKINVIKVIDTRITVPRLRLEVYPDFVKEHLLLLEDFDEHILRLIYYYERKIVNERTVRLAYILISLSLLLLVPILVAFIQESTQSVPAQITAMFTGFFALYQGVSKWLESRNVIGTYWQTKSNLMSRLLSIESKWSYAYGPEDTWQEEDLIKLRDDLRLAVRFGLDCAKTEKQIFFDNYSYPQFNILGTILGTRSQIQELFKREETVVESPQGIVKVTNPRVKLAQLTEIADKPTQDRTSETSTSDPSGGAVARNQVAKISPPFMWILDNGHGKNQRGKKSPFFDDGTRLEEWEFNRDIVARMIEKLQAENINFLNLVPETEVGSFLTKRINRANEFKLTQKLPCIYLSIHSNANGNGVEWDSKRARGVETWYYPGSFEGLKLASAFQRELIFALSWKDRGIRSHAKGHPKLFRVLKETKMPAVLTESGFYTDKEEATLLMKPEIRQRIADAHVAAILKIEKEGLENILDYKKKRNIPI